MENISFGDRLREIRERQGVTQKDFAEQLGCSRASYAYYETGKYAPDINFIMAIYDKTQYPLDYILGYTDNDTPTAVGLDKSLGLSVKALNRLRADKNTRLVINRLLESNYVGGIAKSLIKYNYVSACEVVLKKEYSSMDVHSLLMRELEFNLFYAQMQIKDAFTAISENDSFSYPPLNRQELDERIQKEMETRYHHNTFINPVYISDGERAIMSMEIVLAMVKEIWGD